MPLSSRHPAISTDDIDVILESVKASRCFGKSKRQMHLFEYLLQHSLLGTSSELSQYSIALDVLDRTEDFDPTTDSIVRVELHRLRANLEVYNNSQSAYLIKIPPASFDVVVSPRKQGWIDKLTSKTGLFAAALTLIVGGFAGGFLSKSDLRPSQQACSAVTPNLAVTYIGETSDTHKYVESVVRSAFSEQTSFHVLEGAPSCGSKSAPVFNVQFTIVEQDDLFNVAFEVLDAAANTVIESHHIKGALTDTKEETELYYKLVSTANDIAIPGSITARYAYNGIWGSDIAKTNYGCIIAMYDSYSGELDSEFDNVHSCLENAIESGIATLDNYGALASSYFDKARNSRPSSVDDPLSQGQSILEQHSNQWVESSELAIARLYSETDRLDFNAEQMELALITTQAKFKTNPQVLLSVASIYGYDLGRWDEAKAISDHVKRIYSIRDQSVFYTDAGYALMRGTGVQDMDVCYKFYSKDSIFISILVNACAVSANNEDWIARTESNLTRFDMTDIDSRIAYIDKRVKGKALINKIKSVLSEANID